MAIRAANLFWKLLGQCDEWLLESEVAVALQVLLELLLIHTSDFRCHMQLFKLFAWQISDVTRHMLVTCQMSHFQMSHALGQCDGGFAV
jgi:hypothetical protein